MRIPHPFRRHGRADIPTIRTVVPLQSDADYILLMEQITSVEQVEHIREVLKTAFPSRRIVIMVVPDVDRVRFVEVPKKQKPIARQKTATNT